MRSWFLPFLAVILSCGTLQAQAQATQFSLRGLSLPNFTAGSQIRLVWQNTQTSLLNLNISEKRVSFLPLNTTPTTLPTVAGLNDALGLEGCGFTPTLTPADAKVLGTDLLLFGPDNKPYASIEVRGNQGNFYTRSYLVYADKAVDVRAKGECSSFRNGTMDETIKLKKGWNWVVYLTLQLPVQKDGEVMTRTQVQVLPIPIGQFELAPLSNP